MKILVTCLDQEILWAIDDEIGGLYSIDLKTFETQCVIDCQKLFPYGKFEVLSLFKWKENCIVIVPLKIQAPSYLWLLALPLGPVSFLPYPHLSFRRSF